MKYLRRLPHPIDAIQFNGDNLEEVSEFVENKGDYWVMEGKAYPFISSRGTHDVLFSIIPNDWIINNQDNDIFVLNNDDFNKQSIDAMQLKEDNFDEVAKFLITVVGDSDIRHVPIGAWIIKDNGEVSIMKEEEFNKLYKPLKEHVEYLLN